MKQVSADQPTMNATVDQQAVAVEELGQNLAYASSAADEISAHVRMSDDDHLAAPTGSRRPSSSRRW
ncbi:MAG: hypothetical protein P8N02_17615 [Actinomycetota bacterium]|nr:hypothetical protein [Actinomycetota bacterium]